MAYQTGTATSSSNLLSTLQTFAQANGFTLTGSVLHSSNSFTKVVTADGTGFQGLSFKGYYAADGTTNPSPGICYLNIPTANWPATYYLFGFTTPSPVCFLVVQYGTEFCTWGMFGELVKSTTLYTGGGFYSAQKRFNNLTTLFDGDPTGESYYDYYQSGMPFFKSLRGSSSGYQPDGIAHNVNGASWSGGVTWSGSNPSLVAIGLADFAGLLYDRSPNNWNNQSVLIPLRCLLAVTSTLSMDLGYIPNIRLVRNDFYNIGDEIVLGSDHWKVFPWVKRDLANPRRTSNASQFNHSGTMGFAIKAN